MTLSLSVLSHLIIFVIGATAALISKLVIKEEKVPGGCGGEQ